MYLFIYLFAIYYLSFGVDLLMNMLCCYIGENLTEIEFTYLPLICTKHSF